MLTFYEGNDLSQNQVCTLEWTEVGQFASQSLVKCLIVSLLLYVRVTTGTSNISMPARMTKRGLE